MGANIALTWDAAANIWPLSVAPGGRYMRTAGGRPFPLWVTTLWEMVNELTAAQVLQVLDDISSRGFTGFILQATNPVRYVASSVAPACRGASMAMPFKNTSGATWDGDPTFANNIVNGVTSPAPGNFDAAFDKPEAAYWAFLEFILVEAAKRGLVVILDLFYFGFNQGATDGWIQTINSAYNTQAVCFAFGQYLGGFLKNHPNIILDFGTDTFPAAGECQARIQKIHDGIVSAGCTALWTGHYQRSSDAVDGVFAVDVNQVYPGQGGGAHAPPIARTRRAYARSPAKPVFVGEWEYEGEGAHTREQVRSGGWCAFLEGIGGYTFGNSPVWTFDTGWQTALASNGAQDMQRMIAFFNALPWYNLIPSAQTGMGTIVTAGQGTAQTIGSVGAGDTNNGNDWISAACTSAGDYLIAYFPNGHSGTGTIDMTLLTHSAMAVCSWYNPATGATVAIGSIATTSAHAFTTPGSNSDAGDWVLKAAA